MLGYPVFPTSSDIVFCFLGQLLLFFNAVFDRCEVWGEGLVDLGLMSCSVVA